MDDYISDIRDRQDKFEGRVTHLEATVTEEAGLRAAMDTKLDEIASKLWPKLDEHGAKLDEHGAKLGAHEKSLSALRETQAEHTVRLCGIEKDLGTVKDDVVTLKGDVATLKDNMATVKVGVHAILDMLDTHLAKKSLASRLAGRFTRRRDSGIFEI